ncbi:MAG: uracil-DNA glycosylase [Candidatus Helarchaeota archaeon]
MKECFWYQVCPMKRFFEEGKLEEKWILEYCKGDYNKCIRKKMEDKGKYHPDNMLPDGTIRNDLI